MKRMFSVGGSLHVLTVSISINKADDGFRFKCYFYDESGASMVNPLGSPLGELTINIQPH